MIIFWVVIMYQALLFIWLKIILLSQYVYEIFISHYYHSDIAD